MKDSTHGPVLPVRELLDTAQQLIAKANETYQTVALPCGSRALAFAIEDPQFIGSEYEVTYTDRTEVDFDNDGAWTSVECRYAAVPEAIVPAQIRDYVAKSFAGQTIRKIERNKYTWEAELMNGLEIKFDKNFQVIDIDD